MVVVAAAAVVFAVVVFGCNFLHKFGRVCMVRTEGVRFYSAHLRDNFSNLNLKFAV